MGIAIVTITVMPESPEADFDSIGAKAKIEIEKMHGKVGKIEVEPVAFGLKAIKLMFSIDEKHGSPDPIAEVIAKFPGITSAEITDVRRAIG